MMKAHLRLVSLAASAKERRPYFVMIAGAVGEAIFLLWALHRGFSMMGGMQAAALHGVSSVALAWGYWQTARAQPHGPALFWFLLAVNLAMPGAALLVLFALLGVRPSPKRSRVPLSIYQPAALWEGERPGEPRAGLNDASPHDFASRPVRQSILEILQHTEGPGRADAILALKEIEPIQALPLLRRALQDSDDLVRIYAQNLLNRIVERVEGSTRQLERQLKESRRPSCLVRLAEQYHELVYLGVVAEPEGRRSLLGKALALLEEAIVLEPGNAHLHLLALKYSLRNRDLPGSRRHLANAEAMPGCAAEQLLALKGELAFLEKDWAALHSLLEEAQPRAAGQMAAICQFWAEDSHSLESEETTADRRR